MQLLVITAAQSRLRTAFNFITLNLRAMRDLLIMNVESVLMLFGAQQEFTDADIDWESRSASDFVFITTP